MGVVVDGPWGGRTFAPPTRVDIAAVEAAVVERLRARVSGVEVARFAGRADAYRMTHPAGAVLVAYRGASYGERMDAGVVAQQRRLEFDVTVIVRDLGWATGGDSSGAGVGAYQVLEAARAALTGFASAGGRKMHPVKERFLERESRDGAWAYAITFAVETVAVEEEEEAEHPIFIRGTALESGGQTVVTLGAAPHTFDGEGVIELAHGNVVALEAKTGSGAALTEGTDYTLDRTRGVVRALAGGAAGANDTILIAYSYAERVVAESGQAAPGA